MSRTIAGIRVDSTSPTCTTDFHCALGAPEKPKGGESMSFQDLVSYLRARFAVEEGQTMAEYGVVLAVIAVGVVLALTALSGGISGAIGRVISAL